MMSKAMVQTRDIHRLVSADGLRWKPIRPDPLIRRLQDQVNDGPHAAFWDPWQSRYVIYKRGWWGSTPEKQMDASGTSGEANRTVRRFTSPDFRTWDGPEWVEIPFGTQPREQFYTSAAIPYPWEILELLDRQAGILNDATHRIGINRVVARNREYPASIAHDHVLALIHDPETSSLKRTNRPKVIDSWDLRHARQRPQPLGFVVPQRFSLPPPSTPESQT